MLLVRSFSLKTLILSLGFVFAAMIFMSGQIAYAASPSCPDLTGTGAPVLVNGVPNSGVTYFDSPDAPALIYEACVDDNVLPAGNGPFDIKGWAWNDNLSWISFYCGDEDNNPITPHTNLGIACGTIEYGVQMEGLVPAVPGQEGRMSGYAWNDNAGWISFNCADGGTCAIVDYYVEIETVQNACLGEVFSTSPPVGCVARPVPSVFAWTDNVGWLDFTGIKLPWVQLITIAVDVDLEIKTVGGDEVTTVSKLNAPIADNSDAYEIILHLTKSFDGSAINPADYTVSTEITWIDNVDVDQAKLAEDGPYNINNNGAVIKPFTFSGVYSGDAYTEEVTSYAPTSSMNGYDAGLDGTVDSSYETFVLGNPLGGPVPSNDVALVDVKVSVLHPATGICAYGGPGCALQSVGEYMGQNLHFVPAVEVVELNDDIYGDTISARSGVANKINYQTVRRGTLLAASGDLIDLNMAVENPPGIFKYVIELAGGDADCLDPEQFDMEGDVPFAPAPSSFQIVPVLGLEGGVGPGCAGSGPLTGDDAYIYSEVNYINGPKTIKYFSNKLPRVEGTLVVNPVAEIIGNVYSTGVTNPQTGQEVRSLGDVSTNILRNTLNQNVENIIAGVDPPSGNATITGWNGLPLGGFTFGGGSNYESLLPDSLGIPRVYYFKDGDVTISAPIPWTGERTIIIKGGDLYVNEDLYTSSSGAKLGIIVLKDLDTDKGGNMYLGPNVTNVKAVGYFDRSLFSYKGNGSSDVNLANMEPIFTDEADRFNSLQNQLSWDGTIASMNTIGGASGANPVTGYGEPVALSEGGYGSVATGRSRARLYDLNFLRYYGYVFERHTAATNPACIGDAIDQQALPAYPCPGDVGYNIVADPVIDGGDLVLISEADGSVKAAQGLPAGSASAVYFNYDPPTPTLPAFGVRFEPEFILR